MFLGKEKLDTIKVLLSKALTDSYISQDKFILGNNVSREHIEMKEEIKNNTQTIENYRKLMCQL